MIEDVFVLDEERAEEAIVSGDEVEIYDSEYGWNDDLVNWLRQAGFWDVLTSMEPDVKKQNGIKPWVLKGIWAIKDIAHIGKIQEVDPVLRDGRIMHEAGFNIHRVQARVKEGRAVVHRDALRNRTKRTSVREAGAAFYRHVVHMRRKKLMRGKVYAADGFDIEVTCPDSYEGCGKKWDPDRGESVYGCKVEIVFNSADDRPRIIGIALGPISTDERELLLDILSSLSANVAPVNQIIDTLVLDRGYWGVGFLKQLREKYRIHIVPLAKADLSACEDMRALVKLEGRSPVVRHVNT